MAKGFLKRLKHDEARVQPTESYIDLGALEEAGMISPAESGVQGTVKVAELGAYEDLRPLIDLIYQGQFLFIDFSQIGQDELSMRRVTSELQTAVADTGGDIVAFKRDYLLITPSGVAVDRKVIKAAPSPL